MADLTLRQAQTLDEQKKVKALQLDCLVNYIGKFILEENHFFGLQGLIYRYGMLSQWPTGEWGYVLHGDIGVISKPQPDPMDHRVSYRSPETPMYEVTFGSYYEIRSKVTNYYKRDQIQMKDPSYHIARHLAALSSALPKYFQWMLWVMFIGEKAKTEEWEIKKFGDTYINPSSGSNDGYKFYHSDGFEEINLTKVISKQKIKEHKIHKALDDINKALRHNDRKVDVEPSKDNTLKTDWIKNNCTDEGKKVIALMNAIQKEVDTILLQGVFNTKYKHKKEHFEGYNIPTTASNMVIIMSSRDVVTATKEINLREPFTGGFNFDSYRGVQIYKTDLLDAGEAFVMHRDLIQSWILPQMTRYVVDKYTAEETRDFIYDMAYTIDLVDIYCSTYLKIKA